MSSHEDYGGKDDKKNNFRFDYFLSKSRSEFEEWLKTYSMVDKSPAQYIKRETEALRRLDFKYKLMAQLQSSVFMQVLESHLKTIIQKMGQSLKTGDAKEMQRLEDELHICINGFRVCMGIGYHRDKCQEIKTLLDKAFLFTNRLDLMMAIAFCMRMGDGKISHSDKKLNVCKFDPNTMQYFCQETEKFCNKFDSEFKVSNFQVNNHCPGLFRVILEKPNPEDVATGMLIVKAKVIQKKQQEDPVERLNALSFKYIKLDILSDKVSLVSEGQEYEKLICDLIPQALDCSRVLKAILRSEPGFFLEIGKTKRRISSQIQKWIVSQIDGIEKFITTGQLQKNLAPYLLTSKGIYEFLEWINEIILYVEFIFQATPELQTYSYYSRILEFLKKCYFSYNTNRWFAPLNFLTLVQSKVFQDLHINLDKQIISTVSEMILQLSKDELPMWVFYSDGETRTRKVTRMEFVSAIICYLKECHKQDNNFLEFPEPMPTDLPSSMLLVWLVDIRFHEFEPNEQQKTYYTTMLEQCLKHNVNPKFSWFKGLDSQINQHERQVEYDMIKSIKNPQTRVIFRNFLNGRETRHIQKATEEGATSLQLINELKYNIGLDIDNSAIQIKSGMDHIVFQLLTVMSSLLEQGTIDLVTDADQVRLNHLHMCLVLYNKKIIYSRESQQYANIVIGIVLPWINLKFADAKIFKQTFPQFFASHVCSPFTVEIINHFVQFATGSSSQETPNRLKEQTLMIIQMTTCPQHVPNERDLESAEQLSSRIISMMDQSIPKDLYCCLGLLANKLMQQSTTLEIIVTPSMLGCWIEFVGDLRKTDGQLEIVDQTQKILMDHILTHENLLSGIQPQAAQKLLRLQTFKEFSQVPNPHLSKYVLKEFTDAGLIVLLAHYALLLQTENILEVFKQLSTRPIPPKQVQISLPILFNQQNVIDQEPVWPITTVVNAIKSYYSGKPEIGKQCQATFNGAMGLLRAYLVDAEYFQLAVQVGQPQYMGDVEIKTILQQGSDSKIRFTNFICAVQNKALAPRVDQECLKVLDLFEPQLSVGALFFLAMVVIKNRNKRVQELIFQNLIRCHIFKVRPKSDRAQRIVAETLKSFTGIMMEEAKRLVKRCPDNIFRLGGKQSYDNSHIINRLFGIVCCLPDQCLNELKLSKQTGISQKQQQWQSQKQSDKEDETSKSQDKDNEIGDEQGGVDHLESQQNDNDDEEEQYSEQDDLQVNVQQEEISDILLHKKPGFCTYNEYVRIREQLDIAIKSDYAWLEKAVKEKSLLDNDIENYMAGIVATIILLESAQKRVITKMNPQLYNALTFRGLDVAREENEDKTRQEKQLKLKYKMFSDSEFDPQQNSEYDDSQNSWNQGNNENMEVLSSVLSNGVQIYDINVDNTGMINITIPEEALEGLQMSLEHGSLDIFDNMMSEMPSDPQLDYMMKKQSSLEPCEVDIKPQSFTSLEMDKIVQILLFKMFDLSVQEFVRYISFYKKFAAFSFGSSSFINSLMLLLRLNEDSVDIEQLQKYPILYKCCKRPNQVMTNYEIYIRNAIFLLNNIDFANNNMRYKEGELGIEVVELIADSIKLSKQPHIISLILLAYRNLDDDAFLQKIQGAIQLLCDSKHGRKLSSIKTKHIVDLAKASYKNHSTILFVSNVLEIAIKRLPQFLGAYLQHVAPLLLEDMVYMSQRLTTLQQNILKDPEAKESNIVLILEITKVYEQNWEVYYHSIKEMLSLMLKEHQKKFTQVKEDLLNQIFTNKDLIMALTIALNHINFAAKYLRMPNGNPTDNALDIVQNLLKAPSLIALVYSASKKYIKFEKSTLVSAYLDQFMFKPDEFKFSGFNQVANLMLPLLDLETFCIKKFQKVVLPPIFDNPEQGYRLPSAFRVVDVEKKEPGSQKLNITRECSFDIAFFQLRMASFQIEYDQEEGNDQGGLRREFLRGWKGVGIGQQHFFIGRILGIAYSDENLYGGTLDIPMTTALTNYKPDLKLMEDVDPEVHKNLVWLKQNQVEDIGLYFVRNRDYYGLEITDQLKPNGSKIMVTGENKLQYIDLYIKSYLFAGREQQLEQLKKGFYSVIPPKCVSILTPQQLLILLTGVDTIDISQLKKRVTYQGYSEFSQTIKWFWELVESFSEKEKQTLLYFLTGTHKVPLGLKNYYLNITRTSDADKLPVAHTCFNTLDLPEYTTKTVFLEKVKTAIFEGHDSYGIM